MTYNPNGRFKLVESAALSPGETLLTQSTDGPMIDSGRSINAPGTPMWRGRVYFSKDEIREMADQFGLFDDYEAQREEQARESMVESDQAYARGYDAGYAAKVDATAGELVERMRARVERDRGARRVDVEQQDNQAAADAAEPGAEAAGVERRDDVRDADGAGDAPAA